MTERTKISFLNFARIFFKNFDGTSGEYHSSDGKKYKCNISHSPKYSYFEECQNMFWQAKEYDSSIIFDPAFCKAFHQYTKSNERGSEIFGGGIPQNLFPIPSVVHEFFQYLPIKSSFLDVKKLELELKSSSAELEKLIRLLISNGVSFNKISADVERLKPELAKLQSEFDEAENDFTALSNLGFAFNEAKKRFKEELVVSAADRNSFSHLMKQAEARRNLLSEELDALKKAISEKELVASQHNTEILLLKREQEIYDKMVKQTKTALLKAKAQLLSMLEDLGPRTIEILKNDADLSKHLEMMLSANRVPADACGSSDWRFFIEFEFRWKIQIPVQFGMMISKMVRNSFSRFPGPEPRRLLSFDAIFRQLPKDMQMLYRQPRNFAINHSILIVLSSKLSNTAFTRQFSLTIQRRFLARLAKNLTLGLGFQKIHRSAMVNSIE
jgi:hypothetical protein